MRIGYILANSTENLDYIKTKIPQIGKSLNHYLAQNTYGTKLQFIDINCSFQSRQGNQKETGFQIKRFSSKLGILNVEFTLADSFGNQSRTCLLYTSPSPRDRTRSRMPSSA